MSSVPVVDQNNKPMMPTSPGRARRFIKSKKATPFWKGPIFCIRLNFKPSDTKIQQICAGIDPGSKREGFTVKSKSRTYLNIQSDTVSWVKKNLKTCREMRRTRRNRNTPCRKCRSNRSRSKTWLPPSTKARWQCKLRIVNILRKAYPISDYAVEDVRAETKKGKKKSWNKNFSPLEVGKTWFYSELKKLGKLHLYSGKDTWNLRKSLKLEKSKNKLSDVFEAHCVDSWVLANDIVSGHETPDDRRILRMIPLQLHRRQLHRLNFSKGGIRKNYGGTLSIGLKRGSLVTHKKWGKCYVGGASKGKVSLHRLDDGKRLTQCAKVNDVVFRSYNSFRWQLLPALKDGVSAAKIIQGDV